MFAEIDSASLHHFFALIFAVIRRAVSGLEVSQQKEASKLLCGRLFCVPGFGQCEIGKTHRLR
jgi:hypothetical protein